MKKIVFILRCCVYVQRLKCEILLKTRWTQHIAKLLAVLYVPVLSWATIKNFSLFRRNQNSKYGARILVR